MVAFRPPNQSPTGIDQTRPDSTMELVGAILGAISTLYLGAI
jgi:hypothetical protein